jgi:hypothetical protein
VPPDDPDGTPPPGVRANRRTMMKPLHLLAAAAAATCATTASAEVFRWVSMPDAQFYAEDVAANGIDFTDPRGTGAIYSDITRWIVDQLGTDSEIHYVQQLGDLVQNGEILEEWVLAEQAMDILEDAGIIYGAAEGNHDCAFGFDNCRDELGEGSYHANYLTYFGPNSDYGNSTFADQPWYRSSPSGVSNAQLIEFEGRKLGFINLSIGNPQAELDWARELIAAEPDRIFIVGSHMLNYDGAFYTGRETELVTAPALGLFDPIPFYPRTFEPFPLYIDGDPIDLTAEDQAAELEEYTSTGEMGNFGENVYAELTRQYPNVLLLHSGHNCGENLRTDGTNGGANSVVEILTDYQCTINGGDGWTRVYEFDFDAQTLTWYTLSPREGLTGDFGGRPDPAGLQTSSDTTGFTRTPLDTFVDYLDFLNTFIAPVAIATFPDLLEQQGLDLGIYTQEQFDQFKLDSTIGEALEQVVLALLGNELTGASGFLNLHPDFDEGVERTYYTEKLRGLFGGDFPVPSDEELFPRGWGDIAFFESAWIQFFSEEELGADPTRILECNDPNTGGFLNKFNRCPAGALELDLDAYSCPPLRTRLFQALIDSLEENGRDVLAFAVRNRLGTACQGFRPGA